MNRSAAAERRSAAVENGTDDGDIGLGAARSLVIWKFCDGGDACGGHAGLRGSESGATLSGYAGIWTNGSGSATEAVRGALTGALTGAVS